MWLWWIGNAVVLLVVIPTVAYLAAKLVVVARQIQLYLTDISDHAELLATNLEPLADLSATRELVAVTTTTASRYATALQQRK